MGLPPIRLSRLCPVRWLFICPRFAFGLIRFIIARQQGIINIFFSRVSMECVKDFQVKIWLVKESLKARFTIRLGLINILGFDRVRRLLCGFSRSMIRLSGQRPRGKAKRSRLFLMRRSLFICPLTPSKNPHRWQWGAARFLFISFPGRTWERLIQVLPDNCLLITVP